jgi:hypothetical protein
LASTAAPVAILRSGIWCSSLPERGRALNRRPAACGRRSDLQVIALCASGSLVRASHQAVLVINGLRLQLRTRQSRPPLGLSYPEMSAHGFKLRQPPAQGSACIELLKVCHLTLPAKGKALVNRPQKSSADTNLDFSRSAPNHAVERWAFLFARDASPHHAERNHSNQRHSSPQLS